MTKIIGILNLTMDSFSDGGMYFDLKSAKRHVSEMIEQGTDVIDIGAESTRSGFSGVDENSQIKTLTPIIKFIQDNYTIDISIDTRSSKVANAFSDMHISFINDVSSGTHDINMLKTVSKIGCNYIMTHMPEEHQKGLNMSYNNIIEELQRFFDNRIKACLSEGIQKDKIIIDPGIGFGKSGKDNITILENIDSLLKLHNKVCIGTSNKRFSSSLFKGIETKDDLKVANVATATLCAINGATYLRVHDVGITKDSVLIVNQVKSIKR